MRPRTSSAGLLLLVLVAVLGATPATPSAAAEETAERATVVVPSGGVTMRSLAAPQPDGAPGVDPNGAPAGQNAWAIGPAGQEGAQPGNRPYFRYDVAPGGKVQDAVTLFNYSDNDLAFKIYPTDGFNTVGGGYDLLQAGQKPTDVGSWVQLENEGMLVPRHTSITIPFVLTVPAAASPGDHSGGVVASLVRGPADPGSKEVVVEHRVGTRLYLRVTGPVAPDLVIDKLDTVFRGGGVLGRGDLEVTYTVRNAGNTRIRGHQQLDVAGAFGLFAQTVKPEDLPELLPGTTVTHTEVVRDVTPFVVVGTRLTITPELAPGLSDTLPPPAVREVSRWSIPWVPLVVLLAILTGWRLVRRRRRRRPAHPAGPSAVDDLDDDILLDGLLDEEDTSDEEADATRIDA